MSQFSFQGFYKSFENNSACCFFSFISDWSLRLPRLGFFESPVSHFSEKLHQDITHDSAG